MQPFKPTPEQIWDAMNKTVADVIGPDLTVLFCGINPGLYTAAIGHHFGRPGNRFWPALYEGGFTDRLFDPSEERLLLTRGYGITNIVPRATLSAADVTKEELIVGGKTIREKVLRYQPKWLAVVGIQAFRVAFAQPKATVGRQNFTIGTTNVWALPNPSGLNAHYTPSQLADLFRQLRLVAE